MEDSVFFNELLILFLPLTTPENVSKEKAGGAEVETGNGAGLQRRTSCD